MTRIERLEGARDRLCEAIDECESKRDLPSLIREYRAILAELEVLVADEVKVGDPIDDLAARRSARGGSTARPGRSTGGAG